jgi:hypothetical protein
MSIEAMKLALEALEDLGMKHFESTGEVLHKEVFDVLKEALAKQEQGEPVAWIHPDWPDGYSGFQSPVTTYITNGWVPLYTTPQQRKPLNKQKRIEIIESLEFENSQQELIDAVEAAHGIKE